MERKSVSEPDAADRSSSTSQHGRRKGAGVSTKRSGLYLVDSMAALVQAILDRLKAALPEFEAVVIISDIVSGKLQLDELRSSSPFAGNLAAWLRAEFEHDNTLEQRLARSETVFLIIRGAGTNCHSSLGMHANAVLAPVVHNGSLIGVYGAICAVTRPVPSMTEIEPMRWCALETGPVLARMRELDWLRAEHQKLKSAATALASAQAAKQEFAARAAELEATLAMRMHLQANVAHELRTPLAAVRGYTRMILDGRAGEITHHQREYLEIVTLSTDRLVHLINWMARICSSVDHELELDSLDLHRIWRETLFSHQIELNGKSIRIEESAAPEGLRIVADEQKMRRVFRNLIRAAIQFSHPGTRLTIEFYRPREGGIAVRLLGMTETMPIEEVEFPFRGSGQDVFSEIYDIIGLHGGRFFVRKASDGGSIFLFTLPAVRNDSADASAERRSA
jgi:signal transduction histidine kinase